MIDSDWLNDNVIPFDEFSPRPYRRTWLTIGNFDGVHRGHQAIIDWMITNAGPDRDVVVVTFYPNPGAFFKSDQTAFYLSTPQEKENQLKALGVRAVVTFRFDRDFANLSAETFLSSMKINLNLETLVVGHDFALGKNREGTIPVLKKLGESLSVAVEVLPPVAWHEEVISSTRIRTLLDDGNVRKAAELLGRPYTVSGTVTHGSDRGARIGLPTANISHWPHKKLPAVGVYATLVDLKGETFQGLTNVGYRPTFEQQTLPNVETHLLAFNGNIYGELLELRFLDKVRDEQKFSGVDALLAQIERDKITAQRIFNRA